MINSKFTHNEQLLDYFWVNYGLLVSLGIIKPKLTENLETMFGADIHFHNTQLFFNPSNVERIPYWHRSEEMMVKHLK